MAYKEQNLYTSQSLESQKLQKQKVYKQEFFIFDLLPFAKRVSVYPSQRKDCFAPLKQKEDIPALQELLKQRLTL